MITVSFTESTMLIECAGHPSELCGGLQDVLPKTLDSGSRRIVVDLSNVPYLSEAFYPDVSAFCKKLEEAGCWVGCVLRWSTGYWEQALHMSRFAEVFPSREDALAAAESNT